MFKILDRYIIKTFFGPFAFIFSVLFFIFIVNVVWTQLGQFMGKGLSYFEILRLLFYFGVGVVNLVMPLTILLASIMTFGEFGERYELAAMKAAGISLTRIMKPLLFIAVILSFILFLFSNNITPGFQKKAREMLFNIAQTRPALNFTAGQFIDQIPGFLVKFETKSGLNGEKLNGVYIHKKATAYENQQTIVAEKGLLRENPANKNYLKLTLFHGYIHEEEIGNRDYSQRQKQPDQAIRFDTLTQLFDISAIINSAMAKQQVTNDPRFQNYTELNDAIAEYDKKNREAFHRINAELVSMASPYIITADTEMKKKPAPKRQMDLAKAPAPAQFSAINTAHSRLRDMQSALNSKQLEIAPLYDDFGHLVMYQQRILSYSFTCILFFLIGASLGSIIRKGGIGLPVVIAIVIFILFYLMNLSVENLAWDGTMNPWIATWIPNFILLPFAIWLTYAALTDSQLFDIEKYKALLKPLLKRFQKKEHVRYQ